MQNMPCQAGSRPGAGALGGGGVAERRVLVRVTAIQHNPDYLGCLIGQTDVYLPRCSRRCCAAAAAMGGCKSVGWRGWCTSTERAGWVVDWLVGFGRDEKRVNEFVITSHQPGLVLCKLAVWLGGWLVLAFKWFCALPSKKIIPSPTARGSNRQSW